MAIELQQWDTARYLKTKDDVLGYLHACLEEGADDAEFMLEVINNIARSEGAKALMSEGGLQELEFSPATEEISSFNAVQKIASVLGLKIRFELTEA